MLLLLFMLVLNLSGAAPSVDIRPVISSCIGLTPSKAESRRVRELFPSPSRDSETALGGAPAGEYIGLTVEGEV